ncbi:cupredoxin domain-containing protein [Candidatus Parcubacteria bacterium]|nr:cupredoxin domain-containing protein [Candidatus Parcubacteria bacterium]
MQQRTWIIAAFVVIVGLGAFLLFRSRPTQAPTAPSGGQSGPAQTPTPSPAPVPPATAVPPPAASPETPPPAPQSAVQEFTLTARQWQFEPATLTVKKGVPVRLSITSIDVTHGFSISEFGVNTALTPNQTNTVEFTATKTGTFSFFCSVFCGSGHSGMRGTLRVIE